MSAEATAAFEALSGWRAFQERSGTREFWIWDGHRGRYYVPPGMSTGGSIAHVQSIQELANWMEVDMPEWFHGHDGHV